MDAKNLRDDLWGGLAAMLVALPSAIAFGVAIFAPLGAEYAGAGALAGLVGAVAAGLVAPPLGGAPRLITIPCAPAAAVVGAFTTAAIAKEAATPATIVLDATLIGLACGGLQFLYGAVGGGTLIKYIPFPVVSGYLSGVGIIVIIKQLPTFFGLLHAHGVTEVLKQHGSWDWKPAVIATAAILGVVLAPRLTKAIPAAVIGLGVGLLAFLVTGVVDHSLLSLNGNHLVIGPLPKVNQVGHSLTTLWSSLAGVKMDHLKELAGPALTLSVLLSIDTLKTCVVTDALTRSRHDSNRELRAQGLANLSSSLIGGVPVAGAMGATLVNITSGGRTRWSGSVEGVLLLAVLLVLGPVVAWVPLAALAGILLVVGWRMIDTKALWLIKEPSTRLDFVVILTVVVVAVGIDLIAASGVGLALAILLFIRDQIRGTVIRRKAYGDRVFSKSRRVAEDMAVLTAQGHSTVILELQGNLFFGTTDQLLTDLQADLKTCRYLILGMRRVQSVDYTAVHMFETMQHQLAERHGALLFADLPAQLPTGQDLKRYFQTLGLIGSDSVHVFPELSDAMEWAEDQLLKEAGKKDQTATAALSLSQFELLREMDAETLAALASCCAERVVPASEQIFSKGSSGDEVFLIRKGVVRVLLPGPEGAHHIATFAAGDFFGEMAFLDHGARSADAVAWTETTLVVLSRSRFDALVRQNPVLGTRVFARLARALSSRLRYADAEIGALTET